MEENKTYIAIDLKSFYASVECRERNRDPDHKSGSGRSEPNRENDLSGGIPFS